MTTLLTAGHITADEIREHAQAYIDGDVVDVNNIVTDVLWLMSNAGPQDARNLITFGYLLGKYGR